ncbi:MAG: hypothetical protein ACQSGP_00905 [Frankia sp.]
MVVLVSCGIPHKKAPVTRCGTSEPPASSLSHGSSRANGLSVASAADTTGRPHNHSDDALIIGDSVVAVAARATPIASSSKIELLGYAGEEPCQYTATRPTRLSVDWKNTNKPKSIVLNWNGNNPRRLGGKALVASYRTDLKADIEWYLSQGVATIVIAAAIPAAFNNANRQVSWTSSTAAKPGYMLGSSHLNDMYRSLAHNYPGKVFYSEAAARAIHPGMAFNTTLNGHACIADYIHETPYCAKIYSTALRALAGGIE